MDEAIIMAAENNRKPQARNISGEIEELRYVQQMYQNQYYILTQQLEEVTVAYAETSRTKEAIDSMPKLKSKESMIPIGSGFYASGKLGDDKGILVPVGASYTVKMDAPAAKALLDKRASRYTEQISKLSAAKKNTGNAINEISYRLNELVQHI